jgi:hypothetical protein
MYHILEIQKNSKPAFTCVPIDISNIMHADNNSILQDILRGVRGDSMTAETSLVLKYLRY